MPKWDIDLFKSQAAAGLQGWYVHFLSEMDTTEGVLGPYGREDIATDVLRVYLAAEELALGQLLDTDALPVSYFVRFHHANVVQLTPHEFECLAEKAAL